MSVIGGAVLGTVTMATPLLLAALGENVVQKSGVVNVGLEGMMLTGALMAIIGTQWTNNPYLGVVVAAVAGAIIALLFGLFAVRLGANQVVVGVVVNLMALGLTGTLSRALYGKQQSFLTATPLPHLLWNQTLLTLLALVATPMLWWWLNRTRGGLELRACGEQPIAAEASGVPVLRVRLMAVLFGGMMAGIAGACLSVGDVPTFNEGMSAGRGFIALAIVTSGRWNPWGCLCAALIFGCMDQLGVQGQALGVNLPHDLLLALPYVVTLLILLSSSRFSQAPASLGRPYRRA
ncbi:MAG TPA: ABC transporter permease [Chthonomonadaceae bacterium]|nr:ABC transporter permease [Chthonomonadaceae bacterium]